jgi:hypothetical protein
MSRENIAEKGGAKAEGGNPASLLYQFALARRNNITLKGEIFTLHPSLFTNPIGRRTKLRHARLNPAIQPVR